MDLPPGAQATYSFPVIVGMSDNEPLSTRASRMKIYGRTRCGNWIPAARITRTT